MTLTVMNAKRSVTNAPDLPNPVLATAARSSRYYYVCMRLPFAFIHTHSVSLSNAELDTYYSLYTHDSLPEYAKRANTLSAQPVSEPNKVPGRKHKGIV